MQSTRPEPGASDGRLALRQSDYALSARGSILRPVEVGGHDGRTASCRRTLVLSATRQYHQLPARHSQKCRKSVEVDGFREAEGPSSVLRKGPLTCWFRWWRGQDLNLRP